MTPEIKQQYEELKLISDSLIGALMVFDHEKFAKFEKDAQIYADGTMAPIALHSMSLQDLKTTEDNLTNAIEVSRKLRELKELLIHNSSEEKAL